MPTKFTSGLRGTTLELTRRGRKVPEGLLQRLVEGRQRELQKAIKEKNAIRREAERDLRAASTSGKRTGRGAPDAPTMAALRKAARLVSSRKLAAPTVARDFGGLLSYTLNFTPPYDYVISDGDIDGPGNLRTADPRAGTLSWNIEDETNDGLVHYGSIEMGSFFFPPDDQRILAVRSNPSYNWSWWLASTGPVAGVSCSIGPGLAYFKGIGDPEEPWEPVDVYRPSLDVPGFQFDNGAATNVPMVLTTGRGPAELYLAFVRIYGMVGVGNPTLEGGGAVSGGKLLATVPSISVEVQRTFVVST
jgi:hypothetical protein